MDPENPATSSAAIIDGALRQGLGFDGAVFSDDLEMGAITALGGAGEIAVRAVAAGVDGLLVCRREATRDAVTAALVKRATDDSAFRERLASAARRLTAICASRNPRPLSWLGSRPHLALKEEIYTHLEGASA
jgi:beta-N-acetylhexosaminidase